MKLTRNVSLRAAKALMFGLLAMAFAWIAPAQGVSTTTVQGTVYLANGQPGSGTLQVSWPAFTTSNGLAVTAGRLTATIGADGFVSINLTPNLGATPAGLFYTAVYHMSDGTTSTEYWVVPAASQATIASVRTQVMPAAQALQAVNKAYVDQAVASITQSGLALSGGTLTGPLYLSGDPTQALQAVDKHYVDATFAQALPLSGGTATGPLTAPSVTASVNTQVNVMAPPYNAKGDCSTDDAASIQAALTAAAASGNPVVYFPKPPGGCYLTSTLTWYGQSLVGQQGGAGPSFAASTPIVVIKGKPGQDILHTPDPTTSNYAFRKGWAIEDISFLLDTSTSGSFPHRWPGRWFDDAAMTSGSAVLSSAHAQMTCADIGQAVQVNGAGAGGANLVTTIASVTPCWTTDAIHWQIVTLAATASTTVSNAHAYISVLGLPVTTTVGNAAIAMDNVDGNPADWVNTQISGAGNAYDRLWNVGMNPTVGGGGNGAAIYTQGAFGPYGLDVMNFNLNSFVWGVVQGAPELNSYYSSDSNDYQVWRHVSMETMTYPWVSYNGGFGHMEDMELTAVNGPQFLQLGNMWSDNFGGWNFNAAEFEGNTGAYGWTLTGTGHILNGVSLTGSGSATARIYTTNMQCIACGGNIALGGSGNTINFAGGAIDASGSATVTDTGRANSVIGQHQSNPYDSMPLAQYAPKNIFKGNNLSGVMNADFLIENQGSLGTFPSQNDLWFWPQDAMVNPAYGAYSTKIQADSTSPTGYEFIFNGTNTFGNWSQFEFGTWASTNGQLSIGTHIPATNATVYLMAKCPSGTTSFKVGVENQSAGQITGPTFSCSTSWATYSFPTTSLASNAGNYLYFGNVFNSATYYVAWFAVKPFQTDYNGYTPAASGANADITSLSALTSLTLNGPSTQTSAVQTNAVIGSTGSSVVHELNALGSSSSGNAGYFLGYQSWAFISWCKGVTSATATNCSGGTNQWRIGMDAYNGTTGHFYFEDQTNSSAKVIDLPTGMPAGSIGGNSTGATAITQTANDNSTHIATTAYVASPGAISPTSITGMTTPLSTAQGGTGAGVLTGYRYANGSSADTASATIPKSAIGGQAGTGAGLATGPTSSTTNDLVSFADTSGTHKDSGVAATNVMQVSGGKTFTNTWGCADGYDHPGCVVGTLSYSTIVTGGTNASATTYYTATSTGIYEVSQNCFVTVVGTGTLTLSASLGTGTASCAMTTTGYQGTSVSVVYRASGGAFQYSTSGTWTGTAIIDATIKRLQ